MKRTTKRPVTDNMGLVYAVARSFHKTTGLPLDELVGEASLAFVKCLLRFDPSKASLSTWATMRMQQRLSDFLDSERTRKEKEHLVDNEDEDEKQNIFDLRGSNGVLTDELVDFKRRLERCSVDSREVLQMVFESPGEFLALAMSRKAKGKLKKLLRGKGWTWYRIWDSFDEIREVVEGRE